MNRELPGLLDKYLEWMRVTGYSDRTVKNHRINIGYLIAWLSDRGVFFAVDVTLPILEQYRRWLYHYRNERGDPLSFGAQHARLSPVRSFFKWLAKNKYILYNPASELALPRLGKRLPKHVLTVAEADRIMNLPNVKDPVGLRDRAILETLYSTGMRRMELAGLRIGDIDAERGTAIVHGKGKKDRMIPVGAYALMWIAKYLSDARPLLETDPDCEFLFLTNRGGPMPPKRLSVMVGAYVRQSGIGKEGACHLFRHTMATLMLENGADIRYIQEMLGHAELTTTQIYTRVSIRKLKEVHTKTHPSAGLGRKKNPKRR